MSISFRRSLQNTIPLLISAILIVAALVARPAYSQEDAAKFNAYGMQVFTIESEHFRISYVPGLGHAAKEADVQFEKLYRIYRETYNVTLPEKTEVLIIEGEDPNGFAFSNANTIVIWATDIDMNLRGTREWLKGVISHEFGHIVSIWSSLKFPASVQMIQFGSFSHPNAHNRLEMMQAYPSDILPFWFTEGIAQYEDGRFGTESWDTHRDMILRTLTLTDNVLSWDHMNAMAGSRSDDYEKVYNHGFSLVTYIANHYGYNKVVSLLRESAKVTRLDFDGSIKAVLGITGRQLYRDWKDSLQRSYRQQISKLGTQVFGKKLNKDGFDNFWPKFSPDTKKVYFLSNGTADYSWGQTLLNSVSLVDTVKEEKRIKIEKAISSFYSINVSTGRMAFISSESSKSELPPSRGGGKVNDVYLDSLPEEKKSFKLFPKSKRHQVTEKQSIFAAVFSPTGDMLACAQRHHDRFSLTLSDTGGKQIRAVFPTTDRYNSMVKYIFSLDWSPDGRHIAMSFRDSTNRKIGIYDTLTKSFSVLSNTTHDDRDPRYGSNDSALYFASDKTGIFNIYRYNLRSRAVEKLTNVSGGAFAPDVSADGKKLVYAGYDKSGFGIYLIDTVRSLEETPGDTFATQTADTLPSKSIPLALSAPRPYSRIPNKLLFMPMVIVEEILSQSTNVFKGQPSLTAGVMADFFDVLGLLGSGGGSDVRAYLLLDPANIFSFVNIDKGLISPDVNYDMGVFATTQLLPVTLSLDFTQRCITGTDHFWDDTYQKDLVLDYGITLRNIDAIISHPLSGALKLHLMAGYNWYDVYLNLKDIYGQDLPYSLEQWARAGALLTFYAPEHDSKRLISPKGLYLKLQHNFQDVYLLNDEQSFKVDSTGKLTENFDFYQMQAFSCSFKIGMPSPWYEKHDLYFELDGNALVPTQEIVDRISGKYTGNEKNVPSYFQPYYWLPGYNYYYQYYAHIGKDSTARDTAVIGGKAVAGALVSYRFPLWPRSLDTKFWFLYLDRLYGALNFWTGAGWQDLSDIKHFKKEDWLSSVGAEIRLQAKSFSYIPLAIKFRWDRGLNRGIISPNAQSIGGDRFTLGIGFSFDNWEYIDDPNSGDKGRLLGKFR